MKETKYPACWDEARVRRVLAHYEQQTSTSRWSRRRVGRSCAPALARLVASVSWAGACVFFQRAAGLAILVACSGCMAERTPWRAEDIAREVAAELRLDGVNEGFDEAEILMWRINEDTSRGLITEEALLWATHRGRQPEPDTWALIHAFRHLGDDNLWHRSVSYVEPMDMTGPHALVGYQAFPTAPSAVEICDFLRYVQPVPNPPGFKQRAAGFTLRTWRRVTGEEPSCDYTGR